MKTLLISLLFLVTSVLFASPHTNCREIQIKTEKIGDAVHWMPEKIEVTRGEKICIIAKHDLEGGYDFHGLFIPVLKVTQQVSRHKPLKVEAQIPSDLKVGEYPVGCQFHPKHIAATLIVK